jgi:hypothetical protein
LLVGESIEPPVLRESWPVVSEVTRIPILPALAKGLLLMAKEGQSIPILDVLLGIGVDWGAEEPPSSLVTVGGRTSFGGTAPGMDSLALVEVLLR